MLRVGLRAVATVVCLAAATAAQACPVCIDLPEFTLAERLLRADTVVLAREDPTRPYRYAPVETLVGDAGAAEIPFLVDSSTRRRLAAAPDDGVLVMHSGGRDWSLGGYADPDVRQIAMDVLAQGGTWEGDPAARFAFFESLLHHPNPRLRHAAMDELSRARYGLIRAMKAPLDGEVAQRGLGDRSAIPWAPFHVLMLGLSPRESDRALIRDSMERAAASQGDRLLAAWATALMEIDGTDGLARVARDWLETPGRSLTDVRAILTALGVHAREGDPALQPYALAALREAPRHRPDAVGSVSYQLRELGDLSQANVIETALRRASNDGAPALDPSEHWAATLYVGLAWHSMIAEKTEGRIP